MSKTSARLLLSPSRLPLLGLGLVLTGLLAACNPGPTPPAGGSAVTGVSVTPATVTLNPGGQQQLSATVTGTGTFIKDVTWTSSAPTVATVDGTSGLVKAVTVGNASIVATSKANDKVFGTSAVTVTATTIPPNPPTPLPADGLKINFQPAGAAVPGGYTADTGAAYSEARGYGWVAQEGRAPLDVSVNARVNEAQPVDARLKSFIHMQYNANTSVPAVKIPAAWEYKVADGTYTVTVSTGDPSANVDSTHALNIEGVKAILPYKPADTNKFRSVTLRVPVRDGKLTIDAIGGTNTKINYVILSPGALPSVRETKPENGQTMVDPRGAVTADLNLLASVNSATLTQAVSLTGPDGKSVPAIVNTSGGGDIVVLKPNATLQPFTTYTFTITSALKDGAGNAFLPFSTSFVTGPMAGNGGPVEFEKISQANVPSGAYTSVQVGPDNMLYAATLTGEILRFAMGADGTLGKPQTITSVKDKDGLRTIVGLTFDPSSTAGNLVLWISNNVIYTGDPVDDWTGKITRLSGPNLENVQDYVVGLPRSVRDHLTNSISFKPGEPGALYVLQGSNSSLGAPDDQWGQRPERLLTGALLRVDLNKIPAGSPVNVKTEDRGSSNYNPYAPGAPVTLYATGIRNAYDMVWHTNGSLYVPANGGAAGGNTPSVPSPLPATCANRPDGSYKGPVVSGKNGLRKQKDFLFNVKSNKYYGHPNPTRCEWILNGGNPTPGAGNDPAEVIDYPDGTQPDPNWGGVAYDFGESFSPNGVIEEYTLPGSNSLLKNRLLVVRYSQGKDIIVLKPGPDGKIVTSETLENVPGLTNFNPSPLDLTQNRSNGHIYVSLLDETTGQGTITLVRPK
ncbi:Ig-like domain-containing protein [Deinococcus marmoris]|uniref:Ig-like domain-containing protein n=1 Tax=Deinococcus marmoris TaxID=249408 RepID=UPI0006898ED7|nr:Ig-like domain-containing protein [Deinococcus marmoris]